MILASSRNRYSTLLATNLSRSSISLAISGSGHLPTTFRDGPLGSRAFILAMVSRTCSAFLVPIWSASLIGASVPTMSKKSSAVGWTESELGAIDDSLFAMIAVAVGSSVQVCWADSLEDKVAVPQNAFNVATKRPRTWLAGIPNCGHNMVFEQPDEIAEQIVAFLKRLGCSGATSTTK
jgi:hypothetical protein